MTKQRPFLKWAGGKQRYLAQILPHLVAAKRLVEPFTGAGSIFLNTHYDAYLLGEINDDLINLYVILQDEQTDFIDYCASFFADDLSDKANYYRLRDEFNHCQDPTKKAALFLYLNRHGFNGLCRYNKSGLFNVPYGSHGPAGPYFPRKELLNFVNKAQGVGFHCQGYQQTFAQAQPGDLIYCDPPYVASRANQATFAYHHNAFGLAQQQELADLAWKASQNHITVVISNHDTVLTRDLYQAAKHISFPVARYISCDGQNRKPAAELIAVYAASCQ